MGHYKIAQEKSTTGTLARLVNHLVTGPVSMELTEVLGPCRISATELQGPVCFFLTGAYQGGEHTNA